jgi:hypothetical protein
MESNALKRLMKIKHFDVVAVLKLPKLHLKIFFACIGEISVVGDQLLEQRTDQHPRAPTLIDEESGPKELRSDFKPRVILHTSVVKCGSVLGLGRRASQPQGE